MRVRILTASLAVVVGCGALGCKSAPKMAWWSSSGDDKVESSAVAHSAPQLPSEVAKQAEGLNSTNPVQISAAPAFNTGSSPVSSPGTEAAPPYVAATGTYPSTGAKSYVPTTKTPAASPASSTTASSIALPYNPNAVPAAKSSPTTPSIAATPTAPGATSAPEDRYGNLFAQNTTTPTSDGISGGATQNFNSPPKTEATAPTNLASSDLGDRYSKANISTSAPAAVNSPSEPPQIQTASAIASAEPYRPGGTGTYPGLAASNARYDIATRPTAPTSSETSVPNVAYPSTGTSQYR